MQDLGPLSGEPGTMQDHKACAIGHEIGLLRRNGIEGKRAVVRPGDAGLVAKPLIGVRAHRPVRDSEAFGSFSDRQESIRGAYVLQF